MEKRVLICKFHQETNTFNPVVNGMDRFNAGDIFEGERIYAKQLAEKGTISGAVAAITEAGGQVLPTIFMHSGSGGRVSDEALKHFCTRLQAYMQSIEFDAVYAELHGATCSESCDDVCGEILELIRSLAGDKPVTASCDLHANITEKMKKNADCISGYQTYPHVDLYETGYRAGKRCMELLAGETLYCEACQLPLLLPPAGYTTNTEPFKSLMDSAKALVAQGTLVDVSIFVVQPWLDIPQIASTVLAIAKDPQAAKQAAAQLAQKLWDIKDGMWPQLVSVDEIITIAEENRSGKPVILADSADSPNGGCVGDSPMVALCLQARNSSLKAAMAVRDEAAVDQAFQMGVGATGKFSVGGKLTPGVPGPFEAEGTVLALHENDPVTGKHARIGKAATVRFGNLYMILCKQGSSTRTPDTYSDLGIDPAQCDLLVIKANTSFRAFYKDMTDLIYVGDTPGAGASDLRKLPFRNLPTGTFPFH